MNQLRTIAGLVTLVLAIHAQECSAQMGIRYGLQHEKVTKSTSGSTLNMLLGWDFDHNAHLSGGLDFTTDMNWGDDYSLAQYSTNHPNGPSYYYDKVKTFGVQYRSQYHFMDNGGGSLYFGPTIGLRFIKQRIRYNQEVPGMYYTEIQEVETESKGMTVPLGARLGFRGTLDGGYADIYLAAGTNLGSSEPFSDLPFLVEASMPNKVFFQAGFCYGIGW